MEEGKWWQRSTGEDWGTDVYHIFCVVVVTWLFTFVKHYLSTETNTVWYHLYVESKKKYKFSSVAQSGPTLCNTMDYSMPGLPVHRQHLEFTQTHVHWVSDAIQPPYPPSSPSPPTFNLSQHQGLFKWVSSSHQVAKILEFQLQHQSFQWKSGLISFKMDWLDLLAVQGTLKSLLQHHSSKHQFFCAQLYL